MEGLNLGEAGETVKHDWLTKSWRRSHRHEEDFHAGDGGALFGMNLSAILRGEVGLKNGIHTIWSMSHYRTDKPWFQGLTGHWIQGDSALQQWIHRSSLCKWCHTWKKHIFHTGSSNHCKNITENGLRAGGTSSRGCRHACFFSALNPRDQTPVIWWGMMKAVMAHFQWLGTIMVADQNIIVFIISIWWLPRQTSRFSIPRAAALATCQPAHQTDWLFLQDDMLYLTNRDLNSPNQDQLIKDLVQHVKSSSTNGRGETSSDFAPERHAHWRPRLFCKVRSRAAEKQQPRVLEDQSSFTRDAVDDEARREARLTIAKAFGTRSRVSFHFMPRAISKRRSVWTKPPQWWVGMKLFQHFVSPQHRKGIVAIGKRRDTQLSHGAEERKQFLQSILGSLMQFDRRKRCCGHILLMKFNGCTHPLLHNRLSARLQRTLSSLVPQRHTATAWRFMFGRLAELFLRAQCAWKALLEAGAVCGYLRCSTALVLCRCRRRWGHLISLSAYHGGQPVIRA